MKKALIVVDMQEDFVRGALGFDGAETVIPVIAEKIKTARSDGTDVIYTLDTHQEDYLDTVEGQHLPVPHVIEGTPGHALVPELHALQEAQDPVFKKPTFPSLDLGNYLKAQGYDTVELCGLVSSMCVFSNAVIAKAALPNARILVDAKATTTFDPSFQTKTLEMLNHLHIEVS
jgi:nicotinamidase-related amidase